MTNRIALGIDLGGTYIKTGLVDETGQSLGEWKTPTPAQQGREVILQALVDAGGQALISPEWKEQEKAGNQVAGIGVGSPGIVDPVKGLMVQETDNLPDWGGAAIGPAFEGKFGIKTWLDNDANAYAWGEYHFGAGRGEASRTMIALTLGTGVGGGVVISGRLLHGAHGCGGELGHIVVSEKDDSPLCSCGNRGCLECYASEPRIVAYVKQQREDHPESDLFLPQNSNGLTAKHIYETALKGDTYAQNIIQRIAHYLGRGLAGLICCYDPDLVVIGGGLSNMGDVLLDPVREIVKDRVYFSHLTQLQIVQAQLGSDAGYKGAAALALFPTV
jgi:glucokinase